VAIDLNSYQNKAGDTAVYPGKGTDDGVNYTILGLVGEAGELANKFKKVLRNNESLSVTKKAELVDELGDVLWYVAGLATELGYSLEGVALANLAKLALRKAEGTLKNREIFNRDAQISGGMCIK
jgi:NTP pyrophosphatase (non-canonical NTP hydrolase)